MSEPNMTTWEWAVEVVAVFSRLISAREQEARWLSRETS